MINRTLALALLAAAAAGAGAEMRMFEWTRAEPTVGFTDDAGKVMFARTTYNTATQDLTWEIRYDDTMAQGFSLVLTPGDYPDDAGEHAVLFVDLSNTADVKANVFGYNASNNAPSSIHDGTAHVAGDQAPDKILSTEAGVTSWFGGASVDDTGGKRVLTFSLNTSLINSYVSPFDYDGRFGPVPWQGMGFGSMLGIWAHSYSALSTTYGGDGFLTDWNFETEGFFDGVLITTVPTPGAVSMLALAGLAAVRRRR